MIFRIKFISDEVDGFLREIKIDSEATFLDLNKIILQACDYPDDQMTSFYVCNEDWERGEQITREDMGVGDVDEDIYIMEETPLSDFIEDEEQHLEFVFDPFSDRSFFLVVKEAIPGETLKTAQIVRVKGTAPKQIEDMNIDLSESSLKGKKAAPSIEDIDLDENAIFGESGFNDDEIDLEGFEISDGESI